MGIVEKVDWLSHSENISLPDVTNDVYFFGQYHYFLAAEIKNTDEATEIMRLIIFVYLFLHACVLLDHFAFSINLQNCGNSAFAQIRYNYEALFAYPYRYGLQVEVFL